MNGEFKFEQEIKADEERIARYFDNLPLFMDLPGENEAIFERIAKTSKEKVYSYENIRDVSWDEFSELDEEELQELLCSPPEGCELLELFNDIAVQFSEYYALSNDDECSKKALAVLCQSGKTYARLNNFVLTPPEETELRIVLLKRILEDINELICLINDFYSCSEYGFDKKGIDMLHVIRTRVLNILFELKKN